MNHPRFYLPVEIVNAIGLSSRRKDGKSIEASRSRGMARYSVICDPTSAEEIIADIERVTGAAEPHVRERGQAAIADIRAAIAAAAAPAPMMSARPSDSERGILGM